MSARWNRSLLVQLIAPYLLTVLAIGAGLYAYNRRLFESLTSSPSADAVAHARDRMRMAASASAAALAALWPALWFSHRVVRRARRLTDFSRAVAAGGTLPLVYPEAEDILGTLEESILVMAKSVSTRLEAAREEQRQLQAVLSGMIEGVLVIDHSGTIRLTNHCAERIFEVGPGTLVGEPLLNILRDPDLLGLVQEVAHGEPSRQWAREISLNGGTRMQTFRVTASAIPQSDGNPELFILVFHDVTELKKLEAVRRDFVANVSHEIRTPLTAIRGYAETLREGAIHNPDLASKFVDIIERHSERLTRLTDDLLTLSDLEMGQAPLHRIAVPLAPVVMAAVDVLRPKADHREVAIRCDVPPDLPLLHADADRVEQVLLNLIDNAVKYTSAGGRVRVSARSAPSPHPCAPTAPADVGLQGWVEISVSDTGIGIPSQDLPRLTERFYRVDKARSRELGGTGLGLAIVKHIVLAHGGALRIESELGQGTRVSVCFPAAEACRAEEAATRHIAAV